MTVCSSRKNIDVVNISANNMINTQMENEITQFWVQIELKGSVYAVKYSLATSRVNVEFVSDVSEAVSVFIIVTHSHTEFKKSALPAPFWTAWGTASSYVYICTHFARNFVCVAMATATKGSFVS
jgi:hypothetical protein